MSRTDELLYGKPEPFTAPFDVISGEPVNINGRIGVPTDDVKKCEHGEMWVWGPFHYNCSPDLEIEEGEKVAWDPKARQICRAGTPGSFLVGELIIPCQKGSGFIMFQLNDL